MPTIECTYLMLARCLKIYIFYIIRFYRTQHHLVEMDKRIENKELWHECCLNTRCLNSNNAAIMYYNTYDIEIKYEEDISMAYL